MKPLKPRDSHGISLPLSYTHVHLTIAGHFLDRLDMATVSPSISNFPMTDPVPGTFLSPQSLSLKGSPAAVSRSPILLEEVDEIPYTENPCLIRVGSCPLSLNLQFHTLTLLPPPQRHNCFSPCSLDFLHQLSDQHPAVQTSRRRRTFDVLPQLLGIFLLPSILLHHSCVQHPFHPTLPTSTRSMDLLVNDWSGAVESLVLSAACISSGPFKVLRQGQLFVNDAASR